MGGGKNLNLIHKIPFYRKKVGLKLTVIIGILVFILSFGTTYAINVWSSGNTLISGTTKCFKVNYTKGQDINFSDGLVAQTSFNKDEAVYTTLSVSKNINCDICGKGSISVNINSSIDLSSGGLSYKIYQGTNEVKSGSITNTGITTLYDNFDIQEINSITFTIYFYLDASKINNNYLQTSFTGKIYAEAKSTNEICNNTNSNNLYTILASNATLDTNIDFSQISSDTNGKGIYIRSGTEDEANPIYYYRGDVDNNNVIFANFCWKIVRTTETGGVKLIYNGVPSNGTCNNTGDNTSIGTSAFNTNYNSPAYVGYMYGTLYTYGSRSMSSITDTYYFGNDVTYSDGVYSLNNASTIYVGDYTGGSENNRSYHYTCFSSSSTCNNVYYIFYLDGDVVYYITLNDGKKVEDALSEMLDNNTNDSTIKTVIDTWYSNNMISYTSKLEDTVWCSDRSIYAKNGWDPDSKVSNYDLKFSAYNRVRNEYSPSLTCSRDIDKFTTSTSTGNGSLTYPVGIITTDEVMLAGGAFGVGNDSYYLYTESVMWFLSPHIYINIDAGVFAEGANGCIGYTGVGNTAWEVGVRPSVSLAPGTEMSSGNGTVDSPYIIE
jgi:hypothetical protein